MKAKYFIERLNREMPGQHKTFPPLNNGEFEEWAYRFPNLLLPEDFLDLLKQTNGIQFWVDIGSPNGYFQILPIRKIDTARKIMWGKASTNMDENDVPYPNWLAISEHQDGANYFVLDTDCSQYYLMDTCGADFKSPAGKNIEELLDFIWIEWIEAMKSG